MAVPCVVIDDAVNIKLGRHGLVDLAQEVEEFLMPVVRFATGQHRAIEHVEGSKQRGCSVTLVVMRDAFDVAKAQRYRPTGIDRHGRRRLVSSQEAGPQSRYSHVRLLRSTNAGGP